MSLSFTEDAKIPVLWVVFVVVLLVILISGGYYYQKSFQSDDKPKQFKAVFLTNGQVYFGKIRTNYRNRDWMHLEDVYYLQLQQSLQGQNKNTAESLKESDVTLAKLGNEIHGPKDEMKINREHVLFIETLTSDSKVISAIKKHKQKSKQASMKQ
ncbi:MAG: hypothetical protein ABEJ02_00825 [Candidatus Paceibacteria bacterium]